jgi:carboxylesterase type B
MQLKHHTFRPITNNLFIYPEIFDYYRNGLFAQEFKKRNLRLFIGEVLDENILYTVINGPEANFNSLELQVSNYYFASATARVLDHYGCPASDDVQDWKRLFGQIIADGQVRAPSRYLVNNLLENGVTINNVWRYRINYRLSFITNKVAPASFGVSHAMDRPIWKLVVTPP